MLYDALYQAMRDGGADENVPRWTADALDRVATGRSEIAGVRHPLGFLCFPLERTGERGVCVHVWSDRLVSAQLTTCATHAHSWDLISYVLYGSVRNELVGVTDEPDQPTHRVFEVDSSADGDEVRRTSRLVRRRSRGGELHQRGEVYSLPAGVFHETVPQGAAATVALGSGRPDTVDLALGAVDTDTHRIQRQRFGRAESAYAATLVAEQLAAVPEPHQREDRCGRRK
jgi:hypothetical protein